MARPSTIPTWQTTTGENTEPTAGQQSIGWETNDILEAGLLNWLFQKIGAWLDWLSDHVPSVDEANTWTAKQTFSAEAGIEVSHGIVCQQVVNAKDGVHFGPFGAGTAEGEVLVEADNALRLRSTGDYFELLLDPGSGEEVVLSADGDTGAIDVHSNALTGLPAPDGSSDAATKGYVDTGLFLASGCVSDAGAHVAQKGAITGGTITHTGSSGLYVIPVTGLTTNGVVLACANATDLLGGGYSAVAAAGSGNLSVETRHAGTLTDVGFSWMVLKL